MQGAHSRWPNSDFLGSSTEVTTPFYITLSKILFVFFSPLVFELIIIMFNPFTVVLV